MDQTPDEVDAWRLGKIEREVERLTTESVSEKWLDQRFGRIDDAIKQLKSDMAGLKADVSEKSRIESQRRAAMAGTFLAAGLSLVVVLLTQVPV